MKKRFEKLEKMCKVKDLVDLSGRKNEGWKFVGKRNEKKGNENEKRMKMKMK